MVKLNLDKRILVSLIALLVGGIIFRSQVFAAINEQIPFQGKLTNVSGVSVADGNYDIVFKLYTVSSGGTAIWTGTHTVVNGNAVTVADGIFDVMLGSGTGNSLSGVNFNQTLYLGITVESDSEMTPRKTIGVVPQSFVSKYLETVSGNGAAAGTSANNVLLLDGSGNISISGSTTTSTLSLSGGYADFTGLASNPASSGGRVYYNSTDGNLYVYDDVGASWVDLTGVGGSFTDIDTDYGAETVSSVWTLSGDWINTANPWADSEVSDNLTVNSTSQVKTTLMSSQLSLNYDGSNYTTVTVAIDGGTTFNATGTDPDFTFSDPVNITGDMNLTLGSIYKINGVQIDSGDLSDNVNIGMLNESETVSGAWTFSGEPVLSGSGRHTRKVTLTPEYPDSVLSSSGRDGSASGENTGIFLSDDYTDPSYNSYNYYQFESTETDVIQDYYIKVIWTLPEDFSAWAASNAIQFKYRTEDASSTNNDVEVYAYLSGCQYMNSTDCAVAGSNPSDISNASTTWTTLVIDDSALDQADTAGEQLIIYIRLQSYNNYYAQIGDITLTYLSKW